MNIFVTFYDDLGSYGESTIITVDSITELISTLAIMKSTGGYNSYTINCEVENEKYN
jgi:hypothetical protein